jgi:hypothetical protein
MELYPSAMKTSNKIQGGDILRDSTMNIAFLFNSDDPSYGGWYGFPIMERILGTGVLQQATRHMRVSVGDILTYGRAPTLPQTIFGVYRPNNFDRLIHERLSATHGKATVFCWLFQNMTLAIADAMHARLAIDTTYLGAMDVDFSDAVHLQFFRNSLPEFYRLHGQRCSMFYAMGENEDPDLAVRDAFEQQGFSVEYEDAGARRTIFDNYDTIEHFRRVADYSRVFAKFEGVSEDRAADLATTLEELHPKLFDTFASAARALERAETEDDFAQAALSGRRFLEKIADYLFPPQEESRKNRKVGPAQHKNRLWAYLEETIDEVGITDSTTLSTLGNEVDRLLDLFNAGLHADPTRVKVEGAFRDLALWLNKVIDISPSHMRRPYLAYEEELRKLLADFLDD